MNKLTSCAHRRHQEPQIHCNDVVTWQERQQQCGGPSLPVTRFPTSCLTLQNKSMSKNNQKRQKLTKLALQQIKRL